ncbi:MAG: acyl-ACP--UDP-N-acetylglucosamine O-acyltransferase [Pseudomonadota bacterium]
MIHPTAIVDPKAELASGVEIGPYSVVGAGVRIDSGTRIGPHVVLRGPTTIGKDNRIFQFASVGEECQDKKYKGEPTQLIIGDRNVIREGCTLHRGTVQDQGITRVGSDNLLMAYVHVAHDCVVGSHNIFANNTTIAGHVHVGDSVILGGFTAVHQFCRIGSYAMTGFCSAVNQDIPAFVMVRGNMAEPHGMNFEGMKRRGYSPELIATLRGAYKTVYMRGLKIEDALARLADDAAKIPEVALFVDSIRSSTRGIVR